MNQNTKWSSDIRKTKGLKFVQVPLVKDFKLPQFAKATVFGYYI
jgi:hypothetical protein